ncbi:MAG: glycosyltransferase [Patescibacteria group bacterium]
MAKEDIANLDASARAASELQSIISKTSGKGGKRISVEEALLEPRVAKSEEGRTALRVLFISQDESLLNQDTQSLDGFLRLKDLFEEVHILILYEGGVSKTPVRRPDKNVWLYAASAKHWFQTPRAAVALAKKQLAFASGFRPDLIIARDPFESAITATALGKIYNRPTQLHILENYSNEAFLKKNRHNRWRRFLPRFTIPKFKSVRTATDDLGALIGTKFSIEDLAVLPRYQDYQKLISSKTAIDLVAKFKPFIFFILYVGKLDHSSALYRAIDAARFALKNPRVGLIVLGDGSARPEFERRARLLGIEKQIVFEKKATDYVPYLKSAQLLIVPDKAGESEEVVYTAAAVGVPIIMAGTPQRQDIFEDGVSAYLCEPEDTQMFADRISEILNNVSMRRVIGEGGKEAIERRFHQNPKVYRDSYQRSIEAALFIE